MTEILERLVWLTDPRDENGQPHWLLWFPIQRFKRWRQRRRESPAAGLYLITILLTIRHPIDSWRLMRRRAAS